MYAGPAYRRNSSPPRWALAVCGAALVAALVLIFIFVAGKREPKYLSAATPTYFPFTSDGRYFSCIYPSDWRISSDSLDSKHDSNPFLSLPQIPVEIKVDTASFSRSGATVTITADNMPSAFSQLAQGQPGLQPGKPVFDLKSLGALDRAAVSGSVQGYTQGTEELFQEKLGQGSLVDFTGTSGMAAGGSGSAVHGLVATILGSDLHVQVICTCQVGDWAKARPIFIHMINSLAPAAG